jgi:hypothetical protein
MALCEEGNYFEARWFTPWVRERQVEDYPLEEIVGNITGQRFVPFGDAVLDTYDTSFACETCEELVSFPLFRKSVPLWRTYYLLFSFCYSSVRNGRG